MAISSDGRPSGEAYDAIVIGSGLGGLAAAAMLARAGRKVLVVERGEAAGGYAHAFQRGPYTIDPAVHVTGQGGPGELFDSLFRYLGVADACHFLPSPNFHTAILAGRRFELPLNLATFVEALVVQFPHQADQLRQFWDTLERSYREARQLPIAVEFRDLDKAVAAAPTLFRYRTASLAEVLDAFLDDPEAKAVCSAPWPYLFSPPSRLSFTTFTALMVNLLEGSWYCQGSFQQLVNALVAALQLHGGELALKSEVVHITLESGRATGVRLHDGREIRAPVIISNADARRTFETFVGEENLPAPFLRRLRRLEPSPSAFLTFATTAAEPHSLGLDHAMFISRSLDPEATYQDCLAGKPGGIFLNVPTLLDPSLAPPGEHIVTITSMAPYDIGRPWAEARENFRDALLAECEAALPGLRSQLNVIETATPLTLERYAANYRGAAYGWEASVRQTGGQRPSHQTPIGGLYLAGHWSQPGSGSIRAVVSGLHASELVLAADGGGGTEHGSRLPMDLAMNL